MREVGEDKKEMMVDRKTKEEESKKRIREEKKEQNETVIVKGRCVNPVSGDALEEFSHVEDSDTCGNSWSDFMGDFCGLSVCVPGVSSCVPVVPVSPSSSVAVMSEVLVSDSDWDIVELQPSSFSGKRQAFCVENQEDMNYDGTLVKAPPASRRKIMPPAPQQSLQPSIEAGLLQTEVEDQASGSCEMEYGGEHRWSARDRTVISRMEQYLNENDSMKVGIEELELLLGPEDSKIDSRHILRYAGKNKGRKIFEIFNSKGQSESLVASRARWDERQRVLVTQEEESRRKAQEVD